MKQEHAPNPACLYDQDDPRGGVCGMVGCGIRITLEARGRGALPVYSASRNFCMQAALIDIESHPNAAAEIELTDGSASS